MAWWRVVIPRRMVVKWPPAVMWVQCPRVEQIKAGWFKVVWLEWAPKADVQRPPAQHRLEAS